MRLYPRNGATPSVTDGGTRYEPGPDGGFDFPEDVGLRLHAFHVAKQPLWETDVERQHRLIAEEIDRRKDPATLLGVVEQLLAQAEAGRQAPAAKTSRAKAAGEAK